MVLTGKTLKKITYKPIKMITHKHTDVYGVKMTPIQEMEFLKYIANKGIAMNTLTKDERKQLVSEWLEFDRLKIKEEQK
jgi:hypothetical protein